MPTVHNVNISHFAFAPKTLVINAGDSVAWTNLDVMDHTATRTDAPAFDTDLVEQNQTSASILFPNPSPAEGWTYFCRPHPHMTAVIVVQAVAPEGDEADGAACGTDGAAKELILEITDLKFTLSDVNSATLTAKGNVRTTGWTKPELARPRIGDGILHLDFAAQSPTGGSGDAIAEVEARRSLPLGSQPQDVTVHTETNEMSVRLPAIGDPP